MGILNHSRFCKDIFNYSRRNSSEVIIGNTALGGLNPIRIQSMTDTDTNNIDACVEQAIRMIVSGAEYVRLTAQGIEEAKNLKFIKEELIKRGHNTPLVADIHFNPKAATIAAKYVDKVRINPGNFTDKGRDVEGSNYEEGLQKIREKFIPLLEVCKENNTALRIGTNHGSLSERIMNRYGDTPKGMVEATLEFLRICKEQDFTNVVLSIKSSNTVMMVKTVRLLVCEMEKENMHCPLHLGVTEAGEGEDGRIKSAVGIGALLNDGIGDTIRVSLTENPEIESPVGRKLVDYVLQKANHASIQSPENIDINLIDFYKRTTHLVKDIGSRKVPVVIADLSHENDLEASLPEQAGYSINSDGKWGKSKLAADYIFISNCNPAIANYPKEPGIILNKEHWGQSKKYSENTCPLFQADEYLNSDIAAFDCDILFVECRYSDLTNEFTGKINENPKVVLICNSDHQNAIAEQRAFAFRLVESKCMAPVIFKRTFPDKELENLQLKASIDLGSLFFDGLGNGICINNRGKLPQKELISTSFGILQAARVRTSKTEFVSCPGCGRTLFELQNVVAKVKREFSHLTHLKIGIMGCIVNGPGEMGDVDYGYVGAGHGKVSLYKGHELIMKNIPGENAIDELKKIIENNGDWTDTEGY